MSDQEQIEMLKRWWKEYGVIIVSGVVIFLAANYGWHYWQNHQNRHVAMASMTYSQFLGASQAGKNDEVNILAAGLERDYKNTPYASLAAFAEARDAVRDAHLDVAEQKLNWVIKHGSNKVFRDLSRVRLARVFLEDKKATEALSVLDKSEGTTFKAQSLEVRGDILMSLGKKHEASLAYKEALAENNLRGVESPLLKMKI